GRLLSRAASARRRGSVPPPARMPSVPVSVPIRGCGLAQAAARFGADEIDDLADRAIGSENTGHFFDPLGERSIRTEEQPIGAAQGLNIVAVEAAALESHQIEPGQPCAVTHDLPIRNDVAFDARHSADEGPRADPAELMDR